MSSAAPDKLAPAARTDLRPDARSPSAGAGAVLDALPFAVVALTDRLVVTAANREAERLLDLPREAGPVPLPEPWVEFSLRRFVRALRMGSGSAGEVRTQVGGGLVLELTGLPMRDGFVLVLRDVTARMREEQADRNFVANAAHELRATLGGISSAVEALELGAKDDAAERDRLLGGVDGEVRRLRREVDALLVLSRAHAEPRALTLEPVAVAPLVQGVADSLTLRPGVEVETACDRGAAVRAQRPLLEIALRNVARNAARHTSRGTITLSCRRLDGERVALEVSDDGPGISPDARERLFERFSPDDGSDGFGIGLPLTREIVQLLDGDVDVVSDGAGTTVRLVLPAA